MTVGERGPVPIQDFVFLDDLSHFDRERIPERVVHAKGAGTSQERAESENRKSRYVIIFNVFVGGSCNGWGSMGGA